MMNILSIDWDFFFPNIDGFDWGMREDNNLLLEFIWHTRFYNCNLFTGERACDIKPHYEGFWRKIYDSSVINSVAITDSHKDITLFFDMSDTVNVWNFDQHHDCGYKNFTKVTDCGNWALDKRISGYNIVYPAWRRDFTELNPEKPINFWYYDDDYFLPDKFDVAFICRSSGWTPSWCDSDWLHFLDDFRAYWPFEWDRKVAVPWVLEPREFDLKTAEKFRFAGD